MDNSLFVAHAIGPSFTSELAAAGYANAAVSWSAVGVYISSSVAPSDVTAIQAVIAAHDPTKTLSPSPPDGPTLGDWRVGLTLWGRLDAVTAAVQAAMASSDPQTAITGKIANQRIEYSNNVFRTDLIAVMAIFEFTQADVDESLWRASQVSKGDLSGVWPLPSAAPASTSQASAPSQAASATPSSGS